MKAISVIHVAKANVNFQSLFSELSLVFYIVDHCFLLKHFLSMAPWIHTPTLFQTTFCNLFSVSFLCSISLTSKFKSVWGLRFLDLYQLPLYIGLVIQSLLFNTIYVLTFPRFVSLAQAFAPNLTHVTYCLVNIPTRMSNGHLISNILINVLLIYPNLFFPLFSQYQWMQLHYFNGKIKNIGVTFDISLFSYPTANPLTNAVIIPLTYTENLTSSRLHYRHSSSSSFDPLTLGLWQNLWCYLLLCPYHSLESVLSTTIRDVK